MKHVQNVLKRYMFQKMKHVKKKMKCSKKLNVKIIKYVPINETCSKKIKNETCSKN